MNTIPEIERAPIELQRKIQGTQLKKLLTYLQQNSPFYKNLFKTHGVDIRQAEDKEFLSRLPITEKKDLQLHNTDFYCVPPGKIAELSCTSGTLGSPVTIPLTRNDLERLAYNEYLSFGLMELSDRDVVQLMLTMDRQFMAGMAYYSGLKKLGATVIRSGPGSARMQWETINRYGVTATVTVPSFLLRLKKELEDVSSLKTCSLQKVLAIGESLRDENLNPGPLLKALQQDWNVRVFGTYASTEMQTAFTECAVGAGGHHHPELIILELLNEHNKEVAPGEAGEVTISTLGVEGMPLLRYKTGDICKGYYEACSCGRTTMRLGPVLGRKQQMIKIKGTTVYPITCTQLLQEIQELDEFYIRISRDELGGDKLEFLIQITGQPETTIARIRQRCKEKLKVQPEIQQVTAAEMQQLQFPGNSRKQQRIGDFRVERN